MPRLSRSPLTIVAIAALVGAVLLGGSAAWAAWSVSGTGTGRTAAGSLVIPAVTATRSSTAPTTTIDLSWTAPAQVTGATYSVTRNGAAFSACTASPCTDSGLASGTTYTYIVTAKVGTNWSVASSPAVSSTSAATLATTTTVQSGQNPAKSGANVTLTAMVTSGSGTPTGSVTFQDGSTTIACIGGATRTLTSGSATCQTTFASTGAHSIIAVYPGAAGFAASTSTVLSQRVVNAAVTGLAFANVKVDSASPTPTCSGVGTANVACTISGTGNNAVLNADIRFVNSAGAATVYAIDAATSVPWTATGKGVGSGSVSVAANASATTGATATATRNGINAATLTVTFSDAGTTFTATLTVS
jgi:Bacterial Ig-like domain (group 3)